MLKILNQFESLNVYQEYCFVSLDTIDIVVPNGILLYHFVCFRTMKCVRKYKSFLLATLYVLNTKEQSVESKKLLSALENFATK